MPATRPLLTWRPPVRDGRDPARCLPHGPEPRWWLRRCTPSTRPRRRADLTSGHHSGGGSDRNGRALRQTRTPAASGAAATTPTTPVSPLARRIPDRKGDPFGAKKSWAFRENPLLPAPLPP